MNLWFQNRENCTDFAGGRKCVNCRPASPPPAATRRRYLLQTLFRRVVGTRSRTLNGVGVAALESMRPLVRLAKRAAGLLRSAPPPAPSLRLLDRAQSERFATRRATFVQALNRDADHVLAVSDRVAELAGRMGIRREKLATAYIGTRFAGAAARPTWVGDRPLGLAYLGYMRADKGFYFLLRAFERMPADLAGRLSLTIAAKFTDRGVLDWLRLMAHKFAAVTVIDGYTHATLPNILAGADLGVVPVLWEDNLPQVAIEMVGSGVPVLTSDLGGARELLNCPELTFRAGSIADFYRKLRGVLAAPDVLRRAMAGRTALFTPAEHYQTLRDTFYAARAVAAPVRAA